MEQKRKKIQKIGSIFIPILFMPFHTQEYLSRSGWVMDFCAINFADCGGISIAPTRSIGFRKPATFLPGEIERGVTPQVNDKQHTIYVYIFLSRICLMFRAVLFFFVFAFVRFQKCLWMRSDIWHCNKLTELFTGPLFTAPNYFIYIYFFILFLSSLLAAWINMIIIIIWMTLAEDNQFVYSSRMTYVCSPYIYRCHISALLLYGQWMKDIKRKSVW